MRKQALVIGSGPSGLMAADRLSAAGISVTIAEAKPSAGRKFLMAGKSGLNLTKDETFENFQRAYWGRQPLLAPILGTFQSKDIIAWADGLGAETFVGSTKRVFPKVMKASPLLRSWLARLSDQGVTLRTRWRWAGGDGRTFAFETPEGTQELCPDVTILALGGASWPRLGSDGAWTAWFAGQKIPLAPFTPCNVAVRIDWSSHMSAQFGKPLKSVTFLTHARRVRGEAVISAKGLEGSGIYEISRDLRQNKYLKIDLLPDWSLNKITTALNKPKGKNSQSTFWRKALKLGPEKQSLLHEFARPLPRASEELAKLIKSLPVRHQGLRPIEEAISTGGGVSFDALDETLMIKSMPGVFCVGEMLDWEAPTGGYLISAALATGRWAGTKATEYLQRQTH